MERRIELKVGEVVRVRARVRKGNETVSLAGASVVLRLRLSTGSVDIAGGVESIDATMAYAVVDARTGDLARAQSCQAEFRITFPGGELRIVPTRGTIPVSIAASIDAP